MTLPVEAAVKVGTIAAQKAAFTLAAPYVGAAKAYAATQATSVYKPSSAVQKVASVAIDKVSVPERVNRMNGEYNRAREVSYQGVEAGGFDTRSIVLGQETGPLHPYPVQFRGKVVTGTGRSMATLGIPTANVRDVDSEILLRYSGVYFGWVAIHVPIKLREEILADEDWHEAIISIVPDPSSMANVVQRKRIHVYIVEDFEGAKFFDCKISVLMMGFIRPAPIIKPGEELSLEAILEDWSHDIECTTASLARPAWQADETLERVRSAASNRSLTERYVDMRQSTQKQIDKVPTWRLGVRSDGAALKDRFIGTGGVTILR